QDVQEFTSLIRNELPFENYMEMALWYEGAGCLDEAIQLLGLAGDYPVANYKQAFLLHKMNREEEALALLEKANAQSPQLVFPFRAETMEALEWAASQKPDWKIVYYQGLIWWANQDKEKALALFDSLEDVPFAPFYLSRATLKSGEAMLADLLQAEKTERSWRTGFALINYYYAVSQWEKVAEVGKKYMRWYPENYYIGLKYAKALSETGKYSASIALLDRMTVLPNEGSRIGRIVYKEANLYQAMDFLKRGNKKRALSSIILSKEWPENLGVGKPYTVDDRLENYLEAQLWDGKQKEELLQQVVAYAPANNRFNSLNLITALSLRELGKTADADNMVASWTKGQGANSIVQWCTAIYKGDKAKAAELLRGRNNTDDTATPWETSYQDTNLDLLIKLLQ
ncbi:DUF5107 domain-containing protein, partial [Parabacteroides sp. OttesenSCG-928-K15]|nr:DUF5107 domain-containing protein [Parabacteroides sp. OttesenSCG-928-K15]